MREEAEEGNGKTGGILQKPCGEGRQRGKNSRSPRRYSTITRQSLMPSVTKRILCRVDRAEIGRRHWRQSTHPSLQPNTHITGSLIRLHGEGLLLLLPAYVLWISPVAKQSLCNARMLHSSRSYRFLAECPAISRVGWQIWGFWFNPRTRLGMKKFTHSKVSH